MTNPAPTSPTQAEIEAMARLRKYVAAYEDAPNWGGPIMYPAAPAITDLKLLLARAQPAPEASAGGPYWLDEVIRRNGPCPMCGTLGKAGILADRLPEASAGGVTRDDELANREHLIALLRREGRHSGVWFSDHLMRAADLLATTPSTLATRDRAVEEAAFKAGFKQGFGYESRGVSVADAIDRFNRAATASWSAFTLHPQPKEAE